VEEMLGKSEARHHSCDMPSGVGRRNTESTPTNSVIRR
jgi:hypothetical protein